jgi:hypothetical protein
MMTIAGGGIRADPAHQDLQIVAPVLVVVDDDDAAGR